MKKLLILFTLFYSCIFFAQSMQKKRILIEGATVHVGNGDVIPTGLVGIENGKIILVKNSLATSYSKSDWDTIINASGKHLYPGFMAPNSSLGITEIESIRATMDISEVGIMNPHIRSLIAYNCESEVIATVKTNGVLFTQPTPSSGIITGTSSILATDCWNWEDGVVSEDDGMHIHWPNSLQFWPEGKLKGSESYLKEIAEIKSIFEQSVAYKNSDKKETNLRFEAILKNLTEERRFYFHANQAQQLLDIIDFVKLYGIKNAVIIGGYDAPLVAEKLVEASISVMLLRLHSLPMREEDPVDYVYSLPAKLKSLGVKFCLQNEGDMDAMNARNLPFLAGTAMAYGLSEEEAVRSISLSACEIVGIDKMYGSIETGKIATLFISEGNALDMRTNNVQTILMNGEFKNISNKQTELYLKYKKKLDIK